MKFADTMEISTYEPKSERLKPLAVFDLWKRTIGKDWITSFDLFHQKIFSPESAHVVSKYAAICENGQMLGFISYKYNIDTEKPRGQIALILVDQVIRRKGWGTKLVQHALSDMKQVGVYDVQLGAGAGSYLWPGVPDNLPGAQKFFTSLGWKFTEESIDMIGNLRDYKTPAYVYERLDQSITIRHPDVSMKEKLLAFERKHFPNWYHYFLKLIESEDWDHILIAIDQNNEILGSTLVSISEFLWQDMFDGPVGMIGSLGVCKESRAKGIGLALAAKATEQLKEMGARYSFLGWTYLADWYRKLGYNVWRNYKMSWLTLKSKFNINDKF